MRGTGISNGIFSNWHGNYAELGVNEAKPQRELQSENAKSQQLLDDILLEVDAIKDVLLKN